MSAAISERLCNLSEHAKTVLLTAARFEPWGKFIFLCRLHLPGISDDQARELRNMLLAIENG
jgi:hypothetical protein